MGYLVYSVTLKGDAQSAYTQIHQQPWVSGIKVSREGDQTTWQVSVTDEVAAKDQMFVAIGVMIIMQRVLVGEKHSGTAAWVLSKPVTRTAFVVSRLVVNSIAILLTAVIVPGVIFYITLGLFSAFGWLSPLGFIAALLMISLHTFYWITMVLMMGTLSESSSVVIAVPMVLFFLFWMGADVIPGLIYISPLLLTFSPAPEQMAPLTVSFITGEPVFSWLPLISTVVSCAIFIAVAIWRFNRQEF